MKPIRKRLRAALKAARDGGYTPTRIRMNAAGVKEFTDSFREGGGGRGSRVPKDQPRTAGEKAFQRDFLHASIEADDSIPDGEIRVDAEVGGELVNVASLCGPKREDDPAKPEGLGAVTRIVSAVQRAREMGREPAHVHIATDLDRRFDREIPVTPEFERPSAYFTGDIKASPFLPAGSVRVEDKDGEEIVTLGGDDFACLEAWLRVTEEGKAATRETLHAMGFHAGAAYAARVTGAVVERAMEVIGPPIISALEALQRTANSPTISTTLTVDGAKSAAAFAREVIGRTAARDVAAILDGEDVENVMAKPLVAPDVPDGKERWTITMDLDPDVARAIRTSRHASVSIGGVVSASEIHDAINAPTEPPPDSTSSSPEQIRGDVVRMVSEACDRALELPEEPDPKGRHCRELEVAREILFALAIDIGDNGIDRPYAVIGDALSELVATHGGEEEDDHGG